MTHFCGFWLESPETGISSKASLLWMEFCCSVISQVDAMPGGLSSVDTVQYLDLDHGASAAACADGDRESARLTFPAADATDYKEIDPLKTKALQATRCEVESERRRSSDKLMEV